MKPQCYDIEEAAGDLGVDEHRPAVAASLVSLKLFMFINHKAHYEATLSSDKCAYRDVEQWPCFAISFVKKVYLCIIAGNEVF